MQSTTPVFNRLSKFFVNLGQIGEILNGRDLVLSSYIAIYERALRLLP